MSILGPYQHIFAYSTWSDTVIGVVLLLVSVTLLIACLLAIVKLAQLLLSGHLGLLVRKLMDKKFPHPFAFLTDYVVMFIGCIFVIVVRELSFFDKNLDFFEFPFQSSKPHRAPTILLIFQIQSSDVFRTILTPLVGIGVVTLEKLYQLLLGGNVGTTITGVLAALSADPAKIEKLALFLIKEDFLERYNSPQLKLRIISLGFYCFIQCHLCETYPLSWRKNSAM